MANESPSIQSISDDALRLKAVVENAIDGIVTIDTKGIIETVNPAATKLFGYHVNELIGKNINILMPNPYHSEHDGYIANYLRSGQAKIIGIGREVRGRKKDGTVFPMRLAVSEVKLQDRTIFTGFIHDLTQQKTAEIALQAEKETAQTYLDIANTIFVVLNTEGIITLLNIKGGEVLECEVEEAIGKDWFDSFIPEKELEKVRSVFNRMVHDNEEIDYFENEIITHNGTSKLIAWRNSLYFNNEGKLLGTISSGVDITEQRKAENQIKQLNEELEAKVEARTQELGDTVSQLLVMNDQLEHEIKEKKATEKALKISELELKNALANERELGELKSRFISMASHEFRTPLSTILASAELIGTYNNEEHPKIARNTNRILNSVKNLIEILNDLLSLSKLEAGKVQVQAEDLEFWAFFNDLVEQMQPNLKSAQQIQIKGDQSMLQLCTDPKILKNILFNLLSNAIKYSNEGDTVECEVMHEGENLMIQIKDQGIGIPPEDQKHLFTRFYRATNVESIQGTGLGLSIVKHYIELLNGTISFESKLGVGTTFNLNFPTHYSIT